MTHRRVGGRAFGPSVSVLIEIWVASQPAVALGDTYLRCKGAITILYESGVQSLEEQEIAAHVLRDRINFSGNHLLRGRDIQICKQSTDDFYFDSRTCEEGGPVDLSRPREYGTLNKITGELSLSNEEPRRPLAQGSFVCKPTEPVVK
jgi:hypothetical protein